MEQEMNDRLAAVQPKSEPDQTSSNDSEDEENQPTLF